MVSIYKSTLIRSTTTSLPSSAEDIEWQDNDDVYCHAKFESNTLNIVWDIAS